MPASPRPTTPIAEPRAIALLRSNTQMPTFRLDLSTWTAPLAAELFEEEAGREPRALRSSRIAPPATFAVLFLNWDAIRCPSCPCSRRRPWRPRRGFPRRIPAWIED